MRFIFCLCFSSFIHRDKPIKPFTCCVCVYIIQHLILTCQTCTVPHEQHNSRVLQSCCRKTNATTEWIDRNETKSDSKIKMHFRHIRFIYFISFLGFLLLWLRVVIYSTEYVPFVISIANIKCDNKYNVLLHRSTCLIFDYTNKR